MNTMQQILFLLQKELKLELRQKYAISGILLYVLSTIYVVSASAMKAEGKIWIVLLWIIILFTSVNAVAKSFLQESGDRQLYYYSIANPIAIIFSKMIYNVLLLLVLSFLAYAVITLILGNPIIDQWLFVIVLFLGSLGFSITFTFISAIASKANNSASLMAILGFPVIIPILMTLVRLSQDSFNTNVSTTSLFWGQDIMQNIGVLLSIDLLLGGVSLILFPYLWRD